MAKTLASLQAQIQKLQMQADALRAKEAAGVVQKIRTAIEFYQLTPSDLFGETAGATTRAKRSAPTAQKAKASPKKTSARPLKYADGEGNTWVGQGKRPAWFVKALAAGKTPQDLLIAKSPSAAAP